MELENLLGKSPSELTEAELEQAVLKLRQRSSLSPALAKKQPKGKTKLDKAIREKSGQGVSTAELLGMLDMDVKEVNGKVDVNSLLEGL